MLVKRVCIAALIVFASIGLSSAQEPIYSQFDRLVFDPARPPVPIEGAELQTNVTNAGSDAELTVSFITPDLEFPYDYKVGVTFPPHFDMSAGVTAVFSDDAPPPDPEIRAINYIGNTVVFTFRRSFFAPKAGQRGSIKILGATLPESVGTYAATVFVADTAFLTLAGPSITNGITVTPGPVASIALKPDKNIIVKAGTTIQFTVDAVDEFGNHISASLLNWRLDESRDSIGVVTALNLFANRVGQGRVIVSDNGHADTSGNITVTPGDLARIELDIETRQPAGLLCRTSKVLLFDAFGNAKTDVDLTTSPLQLSVSSGLISPTIVNNNSVRINGAVDLTLADVQLNNALGSVSLTAKIGALTKQANLNLVGGSLSPLGSLQFPGIVPSNSSLLPRLKASITDGQLVVIDSFAYSLASSPGQVVRINQQLNDGESFIADETELVTTSGPGVDSLKITSYSTVYFGVGFTDPCPSVYNQTFVFQTQANTLTGSPHVDTLLAGAPDVLYSGFGFTSTQDYDSLISAGLELFVGGVWVKVGELSETTPQSDVESDNVDILINTESLASESGAFTSRMTLKFTTTGFGYSDTLVETGQIVLTEKRNLLLNQGSFNPRTAYPGDTVTFAARFDAQGGDPGALVVTSARLQISNAADTIRRTLSPTGDPLDFRSDPMIVPSNFANRQFNGFIILNYQDHFVQFVDTFMLTAPAFSVGPGSADVITGMSTNLPRSAFVNTGQQFSLRIDLGNPTSATLSGLTLVVRNKADAMIEQRAIPALNVGEVRQESVAVSISQLGVESYRSFIMANGRALDSAIISITAQAPAKYSLQTELSPVLDNSSQLTALLGRELIARMSLNNSGQAPLSAGTVRIEANGAGLQISKTVQVTSNEIETTIGVPTRTGAINITATVITPPIDSNSAGPALVETGGNQYSATLSVTEHSASARIRFVAPDDAVIRQNETLELLRIELENSSLDQNSIITPVKYSIRFNDASNRPINPRDLLDPAGVAIRKLDDGVIGSAAVSDTAVEIVFTPQSIKTGEATTLVLFARLLTNSPVGSFRIAAGADQFVVRVLSGLQAGDLITPALVSGAPPVSDHLFAVTNSNFGDSFRTRNNPFNPSNGANEFAYSLTADASVTLCVYTLDGDKVREYSFSAGSTGGTTGSHIVTWDGKNSRGDYVRDGVYIVVIENKSNGDRAVIRQAVTR